jgi:hypothetical protein
MVVHRSCEITTSSTHILFLSIHQTVVSISAAQSEARFCVALSLLSLDDRRERLRDKQEFAMQEKYEKEEVRYVENTIIHTFGFGSFMITVNASDGQGP